MSENLSILDGELRRQFAPVDRLSVDNQGGGVSPWVVSDFLDISTLSVSENGLYLAAEEEYDCYEEVEVDISEELGEGDYRRITGKDPNLDPNNDYAVGLDEDGNLTKEMIPAAIHIVVPPRKLKYEEGETIDFTGIHVYLMNGNNQRYTDEDYPTGEIPFDELVFPVTIAHGSGEGEPTATAKSDLDVSTLPNPFAFGMGNRRVIDENNIITASKTVSLTGGTMLVSDVAKIYAYVYVFASKDPFTINLGSRIIAANEFTYRGKKVYYHGSGGSYPYYEVVLFEPNYNTIIDATAPNVPNIAWTMIYGDITYNDNDVIPVQWIRSDGKTLEDTFKIEVGESEEGEDQPDPWAGYADVSWNGHHYNFNRRLVPPVQYSNGYCWRQQAGEYIVEYTVEQAAKFGWLILIR